MLASIAVAMFSFVAQPAFADPGLQTTGVMHFMDSDWDTIGACYVAGSDSAYLELKDEDADSHVLLRDSVLVLLKSEFGDGEVIYLRETGLSTGVFHAAIAFDIQASKFMSWLKQKYPDGLGSGEETDRLVADEMAVWQSNTKRQALASNDGKLQVVAGNLLTAIYLDLLNDWGVQETITEQTIYGGWEGFVSGVWKASGNPYIVVGDLTIGQGYSLTMEAGVQVKFMRDVSLQVYGGASLIIRGSETDSVHLTSFTETPEDSLFWAGMEFGSGYSGQHGRLSINHAVILNAQRAISCYSYDTLELINSHITHCGGDYWYESPALYFGGPVRMIDCLVDSCIRSGVDFSSTFGELRGTTISANAGIGLAVPGGYVTIEDVIVTGNTYGGIMVDNSSSANVGFRIYHCQLYDNGNYDLANNGEKDVDARFNWWGAATTAEINASGNPKNLLMIRDGFDNSYYGYVRYGGCVGCPPPGSDGRLAFADSYGDTIGRYYPPGIDSVYLVLTDLDLNLNPFQLENIGISLSSDFGDVESVILTETDVNTGVFRGVIPVDLQAPIFLNRLAQKYPNGFDSMPPDEMNTLIGNELDQWTTQTKKAATALSDGRLQVEPGDQITAVYYDALNEWGSSVIVTINAIIGGWAGNVSGVWTKENNPYVVVGDITIGTGYKLTMQPGVKVRFMPNTSLIVTGGAELRVRGTESDSVYLVTDKMSPVDSECWGGIRTSGAYYGSTVIEISHAFIANAITGINYSGGSDTLYLSHCHISNCGGYKDYSQYQAAYVGGPFTISDCLIDSSEGVGLYLAYSGMVSGTEVSGGSDCGIRISSYGVEIDRAKVINNRLDGIEYHSSDLSRTLVVHHSHLYGNGGFDLANYGQSDVDAKYNWWGETTTQEMEVGDNPKNITKIYDRFDYSYYGIVRYGGWMNFPYVSGDADGSGDINISDVVRLIGYLFSAGPAPEPPDAGDANCDGRVNIADVVCLINYVFGGGQMPGVNCE
jgi:hypothetical protein